MDTKLLQDVEKIEKDGKITFLNHDLGIGSSIEEVSTGKYQGQWKVNYFDIDSGEFLPTHDITTYGKAVSKAVHFVS